MIKFQQMGGGRGEQGKQGEGVMGISSEQVHVWSHWTRGQTNTTENITFPHPFVGGKYLKM